MRNLVLMFFLFCVDTIFFSLSFLLGEEGGCGGVAEGVEVGLVGRLGDVGEGGRGAGWILTVC